MAYQELTQYNSPNYTPAAQVPSVYGMARIITGVTYHWWGDPAQRPVFENIISWLCRANGNSSANTVGEAGRVAWIIDAVNASWHAGNARGNATTVGYECNPRLSDGDYQTMGEFHYDMEKAYGRRLEIFVHFNWSNTACSPINKARIRAIADSFHNGTATPKTATADEVKQAYRDILERDADAGGIKTYTTNGMTVGQVRADLQNSQEYRDLQARKAAEYAKNEWVRNKVDVEDKKLSVLPAEGIRVYDLITGEPKGDVIPKGTQIDIVFETTVKGTRYYLSSYAIKMGQANGIKADQVGVPVVVPPVEKPEWLKNLKDIADVDMWTRSETPVLNIENGQEVRKIAINQKVRVTHSTYIVGKDYLVLDGGKEVVDTVYLSNTELKNPYDDLEKRMTALEKLVDKIVKFLQSIKFN